MSDHRLPRDMEEAILARLPLKSLQRSQLVSKSWKSIISSPFLGIIHAKVARYSRRGTFVMRRREADESIEFCLSKDTKILTGAIYKASFRGSKCNLMPYCTCNGIILLVGTVSDIKSYWLVNPATGMYREIVCPHDVDFNRRVCGVCLDPTVDDFKIVIVSGDSYFTYSCKDGTWSEIKPFLYSFIGNYCGVCYDGTFYLAYIENEGSGLYLVRFDSRDDAFTILPKIEDTVNKNKLFMSEKRGCLHIHNTTVLEPSPRCRRCLKICTWELVGGSWIKQKDKFIINEDEVDVPVDPPGWENCLRLPRVMETIFFPFANRSLVERASIVESI